MFYIDKAISSYALIKQKSRDKSNQQYANVLQSLNEELYSIIGNKSSLFRDDIDLSSESVIARDLFSSIATVDECFDLIEQAADRLYYPSQ